MRVLIIGANHRAVIRGANVAIRGVATALRDRDHAVTLLLAARPEHRVGLPGVHVSYIGTTRKSLYPWRFAARRLGRYDVVHTNDQSGAGIALRSRVQRIPWVAQFQPPRVHEENFWQSGWRWRYIGLTARRAPLLLTPSRWLGEGLADRYGIDRKRLRVLPYGVGAHWFREIEPSPPQPRVRPRVVLVNMKGVETALQAFAQVAEEHDARLELYGEHKRTDAYRRMAGELGIADRVSFEGFVANRELPARIAGADILLHPTSAESFGQVLAEAAALGIPTVSSRVNATPEVVLDGRTGILCPVDDARAFASGLGTLLGHPDRRAAMGEAARTRAEREWRWENIARRLEEEIYRPLQANVSPSAWRGSRAAWPLSR